MSYDLIIIGGGPGGSTAAKYTAEHGAKTLILEAEKEGRYKCCAGGIPLRNDEFSPIPHTIDTREIRGGVLVTPTNGPIQLETEKEEDKGYCLFRTDFDKYLVDLAHDAGAEINYNFRVNKIEVSKNQVIVSNGSREFKSKCIIIATGLSGAKLQRSIGIEVPPIVSAIQAEFAISESLIDEEFGDQIWEFFDRELIEHGIAWAFPKRNVVSVGVLGEGVKKKHFDLFLKYPYLRKKLTNKRMIEFSGRKIWAAPIPDKMIQKPYRERVMVIGDACGTADPIVYEGIYQARLTGKLAASVFSEALKSDDFSENLLSKYHNLVLRELYEKELRYAYKFHHLLFHSNLLEAIIDATCSLALKDSRMMEATIALFSGNKTRKEIWEYLMKQKKKLIKELGIKTSLRLIPPLIRAQRI